MRALPKDVEDLALAPVALGVDQALVELGGLAPDELSARLALDSDLPSWDTGRRADQVVASLIRDLDLHGWVLTWDVRGVRLRHGPHSVVLGVPDSVRDYVTGDGSSRSIG